MSEGVFSGRRMHTGKGGMGNLQGHTAQLSKTPELLRLRLGPTSLLNTFSTAHPLQEVRSKPVPGIPDIQDAFSFLCFKCNLTQWPQKKGKGCGVGRGKVGEQSWRKRTLLHTARSRVYAGYPSRLQKKEKEMTRGYFRGTVTFQL